jgi:hypothetical protein
MSNNLSKALVYNIAVMNAEKLSKVFIENQIEVNYFPEKWYSTMMQKVREYVISLDDHNPYSNEIEELELSNQEIENYYYNLCDLTVKKLIILDGQQFIGFSDKCVLIK